MEGVQGDHQVPGEPVQAVSDDHVEFAVGGVSQHLIERLTFRC